MPSKLPRFTLRIQPELIEKIRYISESNGRSINKEIEIIIKEHIKEFELLLGESIHIK